jgi:hypothetical protein
MDNITNIQDAKVFKRMGVPLNTPITEVHTFSKAYSKQWFGLMKAHDSFCDALANYIEAQSLPTWKRVRKSFNGIVRETKRAGLAGGKFEDPNEQRLLDAFLIQRAAPFIEYWLDALDAVEDGAELRITVADLNWTEED